MRLIIMSGIPNAGKSTLATSLAEESGATLIRHDSYYSRVITPGTWVTPAHLQQVTDLCLREVREALENGNDVIYDATNHTKAARAAVMAAVAEVDNLTVECVFVDTPAQQCIDRDRSGWVSRTFAPQLEMPTAEEGFSVTVSHAGREVEE